MRAVKILGGIVAAAVVLAVLALTAVSVLVDPNKYKGRIEAQVREATGRELTLTGDLKLSVFPWVALEMGPASLSNRPGFGDQPLLAFQHAAVRVKLLPLLHERLEVARVELDGLDLRLKRDAQGTGNWQSATTAKPAAPAAQNSQGAQDSGAGMKLESIAGVKVTHGRLSFDEYVIENLALETGSIAADTQVPVTLSFDANRGVAGEKINLVARLDVQDDPGSEDIKLAALTINGTINRVGDDRAMHYDFSIGTLDVNLSRQTLSVPEFSLSLSSSLKLGGKLSGTQIEDDPHFTGSLALQSLVLGEFASRFGVALPKTRDPKALSSLSGNLNFAYDAKNAALSDLSIKLDDSTLAGHIEVARQPATAVTFALSVDHIDLDRYRPPPGTTPDPKSATANAPAPQPAGARSPPLDVSGTFALAAAQAAGLQFTNLNVTLDMKDNVTHLHPLVAQIYGGSYSGDITYDARLTVPALSMDEHLTGVDMTQLAAATAKAKGRISGKANVNIKATARGADADDILKTLNGHFDANLANGAIEGVDLGYELALAQSLLGGQAGPSVKDTNRTPFADFKDSATITNGVAQTSDLSIVSPVLKVTGKGNIDLRNSALDLNVVASIMKSATTTALDVPMKVTGTYTDPTVRPDVEGLAKSKVKDTIKDVLKKNGLEGLFGH